MTTTEIVLLLFGLDILIHLIVSIAVGVYLHNRAKGASVQIGNSIMGMVPAISGALADTVADKVVEKIKAERSDEIPDYFWTHESIIG
jgi:hypothetical protein